MSNSNKIWDLRQAYELQRNNTWSRGAGRAFGIGGTTPSATNIIDVVTLSTTGNATDYGDLQVNAVSTPGCASSTTRGVCMGGENGVTYTNKIQYFNFSSKGNAADFGDMTITGGLGASHSNNTRGLAGGFYTPAVSNPYVSPKINVITIASLGNAEDFGNLGASVIGSAGYGNNTKAFFAGGSTNGSWSAYTNRIDTVTIATTGNATDYADLSQAANQGSGFGSTTSGLYVGGSNPSESDTKQMQVNNLSSGGTGTNFGDLTVARSQGIGADNSIRGVMMGGEDPSKVNTIDFVQISTTGNATDFGDLTVSRKDLGSADDSNSGLDYNQTQRPSVTYMPGSGRGFNIGGNGPSQYSLIEMLNVATLGAISDFGNLAANTYHLYACANTNRIITSGSDGATVTMESIETASSGNAADFGDATTARRSPGACSSTTRGVFAGGNNPGSPLNNIDYVTIATAGNATDFGDLTVARAYVAGGNSPTRGLFGGGDPSTNVIDYITIASTSNATDFGDLLASLYGVRAVSSATRCVFMAGTTRTNVMQYSTIASTGNALDFGDLDAATTFGATSQNITRGCYMGGEIGSSPYNVSTVQYMTIASLGNTADWGDLKNNMQYQGGASDNHGGLQS